MLAEYNNHLTLFYREVTIPQRAYLIFLHRFPRDVDGDITVYPYSVGYNHISQILMSKGLITIDHSKGQSYGVKLTDIGRLIIQHYLYSHQLMRSRKQTLASMIKGESMRYHKENPR